MAALHMTMDRLAVDQSATVRAIGETCAMKTRLRDLGLVEGTAVRCVLKGPSGSLAAYEIRGAVIALRRQDAAAVLVEAH